jgi:multiple sugar transport system substrate-binding protein
MVIKTHAGIGRPALLCQQTLALLLLLTCLFSTGCSRQTPESAGLVLEVWAHAGQESERLTLESQVARFNQTQADMQVQLTLIPEGSYNAQVQAAAVADELPDLLEFDGPFLYAYVWQGRLRPLDDLLSKRLIDDLLPSILEQGRYRGQLWSVGTFDSGLGLYADAVRLRAAGIRIPTLEQPWRLDEFEEIIERLARDDPDGQVLDLKLNYAGEWYTYAFSPLLQSAGGDLIDRKAYQHAGDVLNGAASVEALRRIQQWILRGRVDPNIDDAAFTTRRAALALGGHWNYPRYHEQLGEDLLLLPLPDFGQGNRTGQGSWSWSVTAGAEQPEAAARFLAFLLQPEEVLAMSKANGAVPATQSAIARSPYYREDGPLCLFVEQLRGGHALPRPRTPAYPVITAEFQKAIERIRSGSPVEAALDQAARVIDQEIADNQGYPWLFAEEARP